LNKKVYPAPNLFWCVARLEAKLLLKENPTLKKFPLLLERLAEI